MIFSFLNGAKHSTNFAIGKFSILFALLLAVSLKNQVVNTVKPDVLSKLLALIYQSSIFKINHQLNSIHHLFPKKFNNDKALMGLLQCIYLNDECLIVNFAGLHPWLMLLWPTVEASLTPFLSFFDPQLQLPDLLYTYTNISKLMTKEWVGMPYSVKLKCFFGWPYVELYHTLQNITDQLQMIHSIPLIFLT